MTLELDSAIILRAQMLNMGLANVAASHGYDLNTSGLSAMPYYRLTNVSRRTHFAWIDECVKRGVYLLGYHNHFVSTTHTQEDLKRTFEIVDDAFTALGQASSQRQQAAEE